MQSETLPASGHATLPQENWQSFTSDLAATYHAADFMSLIADIPTMAEVKKVHTFTSQTPVAGKKLVILGFADQFRAEVSNSLLKLLEEPPDQLSVLLLSESGRLLPTVRSRVREVRAAEGPSTEAKPGERTFFRRWQELLTSYTVESKADRRAVKRLLYLQPLNHNTVNQDEVLEAYQSSTTI